MNKPSLFACLVLASSILPTNAFAADITPADAEILSNQYIQDCPTLTQKITNVPVDTWKPLTIRDGKWHMSLRVPFSNKWTVNGMTTPASDRDKFLLTFGPYTTINEGGCSLIRTYGVEWGPNETIAKLKKRNTNPLYPPVVVTVGPWYGVIYHTSDMTETEALALRVRGKIVTIFPNDLSGALDRNIFQVAASIQ